MNYFIRHLVLFCLCAAAWPSAAALQAFACEPEWGALLEELGGSEVSVFTATTALQDPHHIQARPSLIAHLRNARLLVCSGSELEVGWLPVLLRKSGNAAVKPGKPGYFMASEQVRRLQIPTRLSRARGDIHPGGNPHVHTDPRRILVIAGKLARRLQELDAEHAGLYQANWHSFEARWRQAMARWKKKGATLNGVPVVVHHDQWIYLEDWLGLRQVGTLEPKPGLPPTPGHLAELKRQLARKPARMILRAAYLDPRPAQWLAKHAGIPVVELPFTVGGAPGAEDLFGLFDVTLERLLKALQ